MVALGAAAIMGVVIVYASKLMMGSWIDNQLVRNNILKTEIAALDKQIEEIKGLESQRARLVARMEVIDQLQRSRPEVVHLFDELVKSVPDGVHFTEVKQQNAKIEVSGQAQSSTRVSTLMRNIDASEFLADPNLDVVKAIGNGQDRNSEFKLSAQQVSMTNQDDDVTDKPRRAAK
jgi:type IV pilus assembly protein PilN